MVYDDFVDRRVLIHIYIHGSSFRAKGIASVISGFTALSRRDCERDCQNKQSWRRQLFQIGNINWMVFSCQAGASFHLIAN